MFLKLLVDLFFVCILSWIMEKDLYSFIEFIRVRVSYVNYCYVIFVG